MAKLVTAEFLAAARAGLVRLERRGRSRVTLVLLQNAPPQVNPDAEALAPGTATRRAAVRHWRLGGEAALDGVLAGNLLRNEPVSYSDPVSAAAERLRALLDLGGPRVGGVVAAGWLCREVMAHALGCPGPLVWNTSLEKMGTRWVVVPHPSGRNRLYNPGAVGTHSWVLVQPMVLAP